MGYPPPAYPQPVYSPPAFAPPAYYPPRSPNWWLLSGILVAIGVLCIGVGLVILGSSVVATAYSPNYEAAFYILLGVGAMFIGLSFIFARIGPRIR